MLAELGGRLAALLRGLGRGKTVTDLDPGAAAALDGGTAVALVEARVGSVEARGLGEAMGLAAAGRRSTVVLEARDLPALPGVAARGLPMLAWMPLDAGHGPWHAAAPSGWIQLMAGSVQEAVDLALVGRAVAEASLLPVLVGVDVAEVWEAIADVRLPSEEAARAWLGEADATMDSPSSAQRLLFGPARPRLPRWYDPDAPVAQGGLRRPEIEAAGAASRTLLLRAGLPALLEATAARWAERTGRRVGPTEAWSLADAERVIVAQGAGVEAARVAAAAARAGGARVGVLGLRALRPFPAAAVAEALAGRRVLVLERTEIAEPGPLGLEIRAALDGHPARSVQTAAWGLAGAAMQPGDLAAVARDLPTAPVVHLGLEAPTWSAFPRREARLQELHRGHPGLAAATRREAALPASPAWTLGLVSRGGGVSPLAREAAALALVSGASRLAGRALRGGTVRVDLVGLSGAEGPRVAAARADVLVLADAALLAEAVEPLAPGGRIVLPWAGDEAELYAGLPPAARARLAEAGAQIFAVADDHPDRLLGGAFAALVAHGLPAEPRSLRAARKARPAGAGGLEAFEAGLGGLRALPAPAPVEGLAPARVARGPVARLSHAAVPPVASLPAFLEEAPRRGEAPTPDPALAVGVLPAYTAAFHDHRADRAAFPALDHARCVGCGACWVACPDGAIGVAALDTPALLDAGLDRCAREGAPADALRPLLGKLARQLAQDLGSPGAPASVGEALSQAWGAFVEKMKPAADRRPALDAAAAGLAARLAPVRVVSARPFAGAEPPELLVLAFDPAACKGCGACEAACEVGAVHRPPQTAARLEEARVEWAAWEALPDTHERSIARLRSELGLLAALGLSRHFGQAMAGGDDAEPGSGARLALRQVVAVAEAELQHRQQRRIVTLRELAARLRGALREAMAQALPDDPAALGRALGGAGAALSLAELAGRVAGGRLDAGRLQRLSEAANRVEALAGRLAGGPTGLGRARFGLVVARDAETAWAAAFADNAFAVPVQVHDPAVATEVARGLARAATEAAVEEARLLRWARALLDHPAEADVLALRLRELGWAGLESEERAAAPPVVLVGSAGALEGQPLSQLGAVLGGPLPVKLVVLDRLDPEAPGLPTAALLALAGEQAQVAQASLAAPDPFATATAALLATDGPAVLRVYAPSPVRDGFPSSAALAQARAALAGRAFPLLRYDPRRGASFGLHLDLGANPEPAAPTAGGSVEAWAAGQARFAGSASLPAFAEARRASWRGLQELAGLVTPFTERVKAEAEAAAKAAAAVEIEAVRAGAAAELAAAEDAVRAELGERVRRRLLQMAGYGGPDA